MLYKEEAFATLEHVQSVAADIDIIFYDVGDYCSVYDLVEGTVIALASSGRSKSWPVTKGRMVAVGDHTLKVYTEGPNPPLKELASLEIQQLRDTIDDALNTLQDEGSTPRGRRQAKIVAEITLANFITLIFRFFASKNLIYPTQYTSLPLIRQRLSALSDPAAHEHATEQGRATGNTLAVAPVEHGVGAPQTSVSAPWPTPSPSPEAQERLVSPASVGAESSYEFNFPPDSPSPALSTPNRKRAQTLVASQEPSSSSDPGRPPKRANAACNRNSNANWAPTAVAGVRLSQNALNVFNNIITAAEELRPLDASNWGFRIAGYLLDYSGSQSASASDRLSTLDGLVVNIHKIEGNCQGASVVRMLRLIQLAGFVDVLREGTTSRAPSSVADIARISCQSPSISHLGIVARTFQDWVSFGRKYASLAAASSLYILWVIAWKQLVTATQTLPMQEINCLSNLLRNPSQESKYGKSVRGTIIPAMSSLRKSHPLRLTNVFGPEFLQAGETDLDFTDLMATEKVLDGLKSKCKDAWLPFLSKLDALLEVDLYSVTARSLGGQGCSPPPSAFYEAQVKVFQAVARLPAAHTCDIIEVDFDATANKVQLNSDRCKRVANTVKQRSKASRALLLSSFYSMGKKVRDNEYLYLSFKDIQPDNKPLLIRSKSPDCKGNLVLLRGTLSEGLKKNLLTKLMGIFGDLSNRIEPINGGEKELKVPFLGLHFDWYNRYSTNGDDAPDDIHPAELSKQGLKRRSTFSLFVPRPSEEMKRFPKAYEALKDNFALAFEEIRDILQTLLPKEYNIEKIFAEFLPGDEVSPVFPFSGVVVNLNVQTIEHCDGMDTLMCLVLAIGSFRDGDICLREAGLRLQLRNGDWLVFDSKNITHFNMPYVVTRSNTAAVSSPPLTKKAKKGKGKAEAQDEDVDDSGVKSKAKMKAQAAAAKVKAKKAKKAEQEAKSSEIQKRNADVLSRENSQETSQTSLGKRSISSAPDRVLPKKRKTEEGVPNADEIDGLQDDEASASDTAGDGLAARLRGLAPKNAAKTIYSEDDEPPVEFKSKKPEEDDDEDDDEDDEDVDVDVDVDEPSDKTSGSGSSSSMEEEESDPDVKSKRRKSKKSQVEEDYDIEMFPLKKKPHKRSAQVTSLSLSLEMKLTNIWQTVAEDGDDELVGRRRVLKRKRGTGRRKGRRGPKINIEDFKPYPEARRIAIKAREAMRCHICLQEAFPRNINNFIWDLVRSTCDSPNEIKYLDGLEEAELDDGDDDEDIKAMLITYISYVGPLMRNAVKDRATLLAPGNYRFLGPGSDASSIKSKVAFLLEKGHLHYAEVNALKRSFDAQAPFGNSAIADVIRRVFFDGSGSLTTQMAFGKMLQLKAIPKALLALVIAALHHAVNEYRDGYRTEVKFKTNIVRPIYEHYMARLNYVEQKSPNWFKKFQESLWRDIMNISKPGFLHAHDYGEDPADDFDDVDFDALEAGPGRSTSKSSTASRTSSVPASADRSSTPAPVSASGLASQTLSRSPTPVPSAS
ncbi:hypothetical protein EYR38_010583 [Pleurotus pulmonarius]|nr:hypothetical protein EYR38_010583 [Pleurotus pulmonarius]